MTNHPDSDLARMAADIAAARKLEGNAPLQVPARNCGDNAPPGYAGHWRDWHRGHGCDKDPDAPKPAAEPFKAGDWVVCVRSSRIAAGEIVQGVCYRVLDALVSTFSDSDPHERAQSVALVERYGHQQYARDHKHYMRAKEMIAERDATIAELKAGAETVRKEHAKACEDRDRYRQRTFSVRDADDAWQWMADDNNKLETMGEQMTVAMTAGTLRGLLKASAGERAVDAVIWRATRWE